MSKPRPPDRFERMVAKAFEEGSHFTTRTSNEREVALTLLRREHATTVKIITARIAYHEVRKKQINDHDGHRELYEKEKECIYTLQFILEQLAALDTRR